MSDQHLDNYNKNRFESEKSNDPMIDWIFDVTDVAPPHSDVDMAWNKVQAKISQSKNVQKSNLFFLRIAASLALIAVIVYFIIGYVNQPEILEYASLDKSMKVDLPDGSEVTLAPGSTISFPEEFGETRTVDMKGEAYFDIQRNEVPFIINLNEINVRVLGTAFNVDAKDDEIRVFVDRGLVAMEKGTSQVKISKGQEGVFNKKTYEIVVDTTPKNISSGWSTGEFKFDSTPLLDVANDLGIYYQVKFKMSSSLNNCRVTANFDKATLPEVLDVLETILMVTITKEDDLVRIKGKGCQ